ncbi:MAG: alanine--tRNA ligase-related protein [Candidatus Micrarchaeota archaeon]
MEKIYEFDPYESKFTATVQEVVEKGERIHVALNTTAFYPGGGGQDCDIGTLDFGSSLAQVVNVYEKDGIIWHECEMSGALSSGQKLEGQIDWNRRYTMMKSHTAEHILFHCLRDLFKDLEMAKVQITGEGSSMFVQREGELEMDKLMQAERRANEIVARGFRVETKIYKKDAVPQGVRGKLDCIDSENIRVVHIGEFDSCACAGLHVRNTGEIGILTISNIARDGTTQHKVSFLVGSDAQEYLLQTKLACERACSVLQTTSDKLEKTAGNLRAEKEKLEAAVKSLNDRILEEMKPAKIRNFSFYSKLLAGMDSKKLQEKAGELVKTGQTVVLLANKEGDKGFLILAKSPDTFIDIKEIADRAFAKMNGKGGGQENFQSGAGDGTKLGEAFGLAEEELSEKLMSG